MTKPLQGKTALITGSSRGIGRAMALKFGSLGADIILHYRSNVAEAEAVEKELSQYSIKVAKYGADLSDLESVKRWLEEIKLLHEKIDIYVANAAATAFKPMEEIREHHIAKTMNITVTSFILALNTLKPRIPRGGKILTISGIDTKKYCVNHGLLAAAKAALEMLTRYYAMEWQSNGIMVHGLNPGIVDTDSMRIYFGEAYEQVRDDLSKMIPMGKLMPPEDVAEIAAFLLTPAADWLNGETIYADGGLGFMMPAFSNTKFRNSGI